MYNTNENLISFLNLINNNYYYWVIIISHSIIDYRARTVASFKIQAEILFLKVTWGVFASFRVRLIEISMTEITKDSDTYIVWFYEVRMNILEIRYEIGSCVLGYRLNFFWKNGRNLMWNTRYFLYLCNLQNSIKSSLNIGNSGRYATIIRWITYSSSRTHCYIEILSSSQEYIVDGRVFFLEFDPTIASFVGSDDESIF